MQINTISQINFIKPLKKQNSTNSTSFKGYIHYLTDTHGRIFEDKFTVKYDKDAILCWGGDCTHDPLLNSPEEYAKQFNAFCKKHPFSQKVFAIGNSETNFKDKLPEYLNKISRNTKNTYFVSCNILPQNNKLYNNKEIIKPYVILDNKVNGKKTGEKILITGFTVAQDDIVKSFDQKVLHKLKTDKSIKKIVLICHLRDIDTENIVNHIKSKNLSQNILILGAHTHQLHVNDKYYEPKTGNYSYISPIPLGKSMAHIYVPPCKNFKIPSSKRVNNGTFDTNAENLGESSKKTNNSTNKCSYIEYQNGSGIDKSPIVFDLTQKNSDKYLNAMSIKIKYPYYLTNSTMGTLLTNALKERTNADFAILPCMLFRDNLPELNTNTSQTIHITENDIKSCILEHNPVTTMEILPSDVLKIFKISYKQKKNEKQNYSSFLEHSNNVKITRYFDKEGNIQIKQIIINGEKLLNEKGEIRKEIENKTFKVATNDNISEGVRKSYEFLKGHEKSRRTDIKFPQLLVDAIRKDLQKSE